MFYPFRRLPASLPAVLLVLAAACVALTPAARAQKEGRNRNVAAPSAAADAPAAHAGEEPPFHEYKGVRLGMTADESRKKLGNPQNKGDDQDLFAFGDSEMTTLYYEGGKVSAIVAIYLDGAKGAPPPKAVFGEDVAPAPDGSVHKMERYPKAGYWLSYSRTPGDAAMVTITLKKID